MIGFRKKTNFQTSIVDLWLKIEDLWKLFETTTSDNVRKLNCKPFTIAIAEVEFSLLLSLSILHDFQIWAAKFCLDSVLYVW